MNFMHINKTIQVVLLIILILAIWQISCINQKTSNPIIPPPSDVAVSLFNGIISGTLITDAVASLIRVVVGFIFAAIAGIGLGLLLGYYTSLKSLLEPIIDILQPIPPIAWIPIVILLFGLGDTPAYVIVFLGAFFPIYLNTSFGALQLPNKYRNLSKTMELGNFRYFKEVLLKFTMPYIFTGLRVGMGMAWMCVIAAEMISAQSGLGYYIMLNQITLNTANVIAGMLVIGLLGYALTSTTKVLERYIVPWKV
jgi:NitT/TauT family transport system permease protein/sulfonate transport system permease protein